MTTALTPLQLYRKANHFLDAAKLLFQLAAETGRDPTALLRTKKLYVLGALQIEAYHEQQRRGVDTRATLDGLLAEDGSPEVCGLSFVPSFCFFLDLDDVTFAPLETRLCLIQNRFKADCWIQPGAAPRPSISSCLRNAR